MFYCFIDPGYISEKQVVITDGNFHHLKNVLHAKPGEQIRVRSDRFIYECEIDSIGKDQIKAMILSSEEVAPEYRHRFITAPAIIQEKKFGLLLQYSVQMGVSEIHPVMTRNSTTHELKPGRIERWRKIVQAACMQSQRKFIPSVEEPTALEDVVRKITGRKRTKSITANELEEKNKISDLDFSGFDTVAFFTGPEGGFIPEETEFMSKAGIIPVTLGRNVLRAETAALVTMTLLQQKLGYL